jgi:hypothetical protein
MIKPSIAILSLFLLSANSHVHGPSEGWDFLKYTKSFVGEPYSKVRKSILDHGWSPAKGNCEGGGIDNDEVCKNFPEIDYCSGSSPGYCSMTFIKRKTCIYILTSGDSPGSSGDYILVQRVRISQKCQKSL